MNVATIATKDLTDEQKAEIVAVCIAAHNSAGFADLFRLYIKDGRHFITYKDDDIVSHAVVTTRWLQPSGTEVLKTGFVDAVSTLPAQQGRGFSSAAMRALAHGIADYDIGCLQTDIPEFYARLGWELWRGALYGRNEDGSLVPTPDQRGVMILRLPHTPTLDVNGELSIEVQPARIWE